jgi:hypothetical protein
VAEARLVVAVLGYSGRGHDGLLHPVCAARLAHAQTLMDDASAVIFSGRGEAEPMRAAWTGAAVRHVCDGTARSTAENVRNVVAAARELGAHELVVVTSSWHRLRTRLLLAAAARRSGLRVRVEPAPRTRPLRLILRELASLLLLPSHVRIAARARAAPTAPRAVATAPPTAPTAPPVTQSRAAGPR